MMDDSGVLLQDQFGWDALHAAARFGEDESVEALLGGMSAVAARSLDRNGWTVLHQAANFGHPNVAHTVLTTIPDDAFVVARIPSFGRTALHLAMMRRGGAAYTVDGQRHLVRELLERMRRSSATAEQIVARDAEGKTALHCACGNASEPRQMNQYGYWYFNHPVNTENVRLLLTYMDDEAVAATDGQGFTALHHASRFAAPELVKELLHRMDDAAVSARDRQQMTALHHGALGGDVRVINHLVQRMSRADINAKDNQDKTALQLCREKHFISSATRIMVRLLTR